MFLSGLLLVLCFPPFNDGSLAWVAFVPMLVVLPRFVKFPFVPSFFSGWLIWLVLLSWVYPTCRWGGVPAFVALFSLGVLAAYLAIFWVVFGWAGRGLLPLWQRPFYWASLWVVLEWGRGHLFGGFPWLTLACSQWQVPKHLPLAQLGGEYAVSFLVMLFNGTLAVALEGVFRPSSRKMAFLPGALGVIALTVWSVFLWRRPLESAGDPVPMVIIQANIDQYKKWDLSYENDIMENYSDLTLRSKNLKPALMVWPETAVPGWVPQDEAKTQWVQGLSRRSETFLLSGAVTQTGEGDFNAVFLFSPLGEIVDFYRKIHLVPFGEYVPFRRWLAPFVGVLNELGTFEPGREIHLLKIPSARLGVTICFEGLFPDLVRRFSDRGAQILVNVTNDGWYRHTAAPEQHFISSVLRAVENRRWVVRAANTGYSGFISPRGEIVARTKLQETTVLSGAPFPMNVRTFYVRHGDVFVFFCALSSLFLGFSALLRNNFSRFK